MANEKTYTVNRERFRHNGNRYTKGKPIKLEPGEAEAGVESGALIDVEAAAAAAKAAAAKAAAAAAAAEKDKGKGEGG